MKYLLVVLMFACLFSCKKEDDDNNAPLIVSSSPKHLATEVSLTTSKVSITYDEPIFLNQSHGITLNDQPIEASVNGNVLECSVTLKSRINYILKFPEGAVMDGSGNKSRASILQFKTETVVEITKSLVTTNAAPLTVKLYDFLLENYGKKSISSTMANPAWNTQEADWLFTQSGKYPAMNGFDLMFLNISPANWIDYNDIKPVEDWYNKNGIVSLCWHWNVPKSPGSTSYSFRVEDTSFDVSKALTEGTWENGIIKADMAEATAVLKKLQAKNIPIIWRPLHEASGGWFWWSRDKKPEPCKALWKWMFNYLKNEGVNNLIWVWTIDIDPTKNKSDIDWYPGDEYVDIVGCDVYTQKDKKILADRFKAAQLEYPTKMVTMSECGNTATIADVWDAGAKWSYFMPWYGEYEDKNTKEKIRWADITWWQAALNHADVLTLDELPVLNQ